MTCINKVNTHTHIKNRTNWRCVWTIACVWEGLYLQIRSGPAFDFWFANIRAGLTFIKEAGTSRDTCKTSKLICTRTQFENWNQYLKLNAGINKKWLWTPSHRAVVLRVSPTAAPMRDCCHVTSCFNTFEIPLHLKMEESLLLSKPKLKLSHVRNVGPSLKCQSFPQALKAPEWLRSVLLQIDFSLWECLCLTDTLGMWKITLRVFN